MQVENALTARNEHARQLFNAIPREYDLLVEVLTLFQNSRWRRFLVSRLRLKPGSQALDVCTGTAGVAIAIAQAYQTRVTGLDISEGMLARGRTNVQRAGLADRIDLVCGRAEATGFPDNHFDAVAFTYLLRYVDDVPATIAELARVLKPGGCLASLDFAVPRNPLFYLLWLAYTRGVLPLATAAVSPGWRRVGRFLGPNISEFYRRCPVDAIVAAWRQAGIADVRVRRLSMEGGIIMWGTKA